MTRTIDREFRNEAFLGAMRVLADQVATDGPGTRVETLPLKRWVAIGERVADVIAISAARVEAGEPPDNEAIIDEAVERWAEKGINLTREDELLNVIMKATEMTTSTVAGLFREAPTLTH